MSQYVCARITRMDDVDLGLFDYDRHNTLYYFLLNAEEQIYMRYGGRDEASHTTYLNLDSLQVALEQGLKLHQKYLRGEWNAPERPAAMFARDFPLLVERTIGRGSCVECHLIADFQNQHRQRDGTLERMTHLFRSPDIKTIGIHLDVPRGLVVEEASGAVAAAGMKAGDKIIALNGTPVWTFGDLQYFYDKVDRRAGHLRITVERKSQPVPLDVKLPEFWWKTDLTHRQWSMEPRVYFRSRPLTAAEKRARHLDPEGFASEITSVDNMANLLGVHQLQAGDIVFGVDGVQRDEIAGTPELYIQLHKSAGDTIVLDVIRDGQSTQREVKTVKLSFRK